jgi:5-formyltetrahydrofolate cyclo-ligase
MAHNEQKKLLRVRMKALCASVNAQTRQERAQNAQQFLCAQRYYIDADVVFSYAALANEADTSLINRRVLHDDKALGLPKINGDAGAMDFVLIDGAEQLETRLTQNALGIAQPKDGAAFDARVFLPRKNHEQKNLLVIVPALAFTPDGRRLGRGKGYYDRALARLKRECAEHGWRVIFAGYCFDFQIIDDIPVEKHDISVDVVFC